LKLLLDTCVWGGAVGELRALGNDVQWSGDWAADPGDEEILSIAQREDRVLVTLDKDFGEMAVRQRQPHSGIIRLVGIAARQQAPACNDVLRKYARELKSGALLTVALNRIRIRMP